MANMITPNSVSALMAGQKGMQPVVQVTEIKLLQTPSTADRPAMTRYKLQISDGSNLAVAMLATQLNDRVMRKEIDTNGIIRVLDYIQNNMKGKNIVIIMNFETLAPTAAPVGNPTAYVEGVVDAPQQNYGQADVKRPRMEAGPGAYGSAAPTPTYTNAGAVVRNTADSRVIPLKKLNPYQNRWTIRARVTSKGDLRTYSNARGEGKVFSFDLCDAEGGEIRVTAWRETAERFYNEIEAGQVYQISRASLKPARKQYNHLNNDYEITLENTSEVTLCHDDDGIPAISFSVTEIRSLVDMAQGSIVDVVGILESVEPPAEVTRRNTGTSVAKRAITIRDQSNHSVELTLWGALATGDVGLQLEMEAPRHPVVAVKGARLGDFNGKTLSTIASSTVLINPDVPEAVKVRAWYDQGGSAQQAAPLSGAGGAGGADEQSVINAGKRRSTLASIDEDGLAQDGNTVWTSALATISFVRGENLYYPACTNQRNGRQCNKKLLEMNGAFHCETCNLSCDPEYRYIASIQLADFSGSKYTTAFQEQGLQVFGMTANELHDKKTASENALPMIIDAVNWSHKRFRLKIAQDTYNDEARIKVSIQSAHSVNYSYESRVLLDFISRLERNEPVFVREAPQQNAGNKRNSAGQYMGAAAAYGGAGQDAYGGAGAYGAGGGMGMGYGAGSEAAFAFAA